MMPPSADDPLCADATPADDSAAAGQPSPGARPAISETATFQPTSSEAIPSVAVPGRSPLPVIPGYEILDVLGRGGMGVVYRARHLALKRTVALKMVLAGGHADPAALARFRIEAEAVARLGHPNIVQIHEIGAADGHPYFALEYLEGGSLAQRLRGGPLAPRAAAGIVEALARAMQLAHSRNVIHRDLKPANVLLAADGTPKVSDFGLARQLDDDSGQTQAGAVVGTPSYMAPEQAAGEAHAAGPAADVYALGAILYACLTGRPPHQGTTVAATLEAVRTRDPERPRRLRPKLPRDLETICLKCLRKEPERRYGSAEALAEDLRRWAVGEPIAARPVGSVERTVLWVRRKPARAGLLLALALLLAAVVTFSLLWAIREREVAGNLADSNQNLLLAQGEREAALKQARQEAARVALGRGLNLCEAGDVGLGHIYLTRALDSAVKAEDGDLESAIRFNIAAWETQLWSLRDYRQGSASAKVSAAALHPNGLLLAVVLANGTVELWDLQDGHEGRTPISLPHTEPVKGVAFSGDGHVLLTRSDWVVRVWGVASRRLVGPPLVHPRNLTATALSNDGKWVLTGAGDIAYGPQDPTTRLWQTETGRCIAAHAHKQRVATVAFSPHSDLALSGDYLGRVQLWKVPSGQAAGPPLVCKTAVESAAFSPDATRVLTGTTAAGMAHLWQVQTGKPVFAPVPHGNWIKTVTFSPDGQVFAVLTRVSGQVYLRRADTGNPIACPLPHQGLVETVAFSPDSRTLLTSGSGGVVRGWDTARGQSTSPLLAHQDPVTECLFSGDGQSLVTLDRDGAVRRWHAPPGLRRGLPLEQQGPLTAMAFSPDGRHLLTGSLTAAARLWDLTAAVPNARILKSAVGINAVAFSPSGRHALTGALNGELSLWDVADGAQRTRFKGHTGGLYMVAYSHDGKRALSASADKTARLWDVASAESLAVLPHPDIVKAVQFSPNDHQALTGSAGGTAHLWNLSATPPVAKSLAHEGQVEAIAFSRDGQTAITADFGVGFKGGPIRVWDTATGTLLRTLQGHSLGIQAVALSRDGKYLISGSWDRTARLWDLATGASVGLPMQHLAGVRDVAFSPDGHSVYSGSEDNTARRWHVPTGIPIGPAFVHERKVRVVAVHPESTMFATGSWDHTVALWHAPPARVGSPAQLARRAQRVTGIQLDESGALRVLTSAAWHGLGDGR